MNAWLGWKAQAGLLFVGAFVAACCCQTERPNLNPCVSGKADQPVVEASKLSDENVRAYVDAEKTSGMYGVSFLNGPVPPGMNLRPTQPQSPKQPAETANSVSDARAAVQPLTAAEEQKRTARIEHVRRGLRIADSLHNVDPDFAEVAKANGWCTAYIPEFQDAQRFVLHDNGSKPTYGPLAQAVASPELANFISAADFTGKGVLVAIVKVWNQPQPAIGPYEALKLKVGLSCVYLNHSAGAWKASTVLTTNHKCDPTVSAPAGGGDIEVAAEAAVTDPSEIPPVVRFVQDTLLTYLGVRCGAQWCNIGARTLANVPTPKHLYDVGTPSTVQAHIKGWFDEQQLGIPNPAATPRISPAAYSSVIPEPNLGSIGLNAFDTEGPAMPVARVFIPANGLERYYKKFGFSPGWNYIALKGKPGDILWHAFVRNSNGETIMLSSFRHPHTVGSVPGTARWAWFDNDEWIWVACDIGCCLVQANEE
jgi:hypothetical protein